jgi:protocatechuate 3,4-dioxygenase beta subunit
MVRIQPCILFPRLTPSPATHTVPLGESIASEGKGEYMYVEGRVLTSSGEPIPGAVIETWETDEKGEQTLDAFFLFCLTVHRHTFQPPSTPGFYDTQYTDRSVPDCRGRLRADTEGKYGYRAVVPVAYPIPGDVSRRRSSFFNVPSLRLFSLTHIDDDDY